MRSVPPDILRTRRLTLRRVKASDLRAYFEAGRHEEVARNAGFPTPARVEDTKPFMRDAVAAWRRGGPYLYSIFLGRDGAQVGGINLRWAHPGLGELGYSLHPDHWGKGYVPEAAARLIRWAFREAGAHRVQATCWVGNKRSARVLSKLGMRREGRLRGYFKRGDWVRDEYMYALARADFDGRS